MLVIKKKKLSTEYKDFLAGVAHLVGVSSCKQKDCGFTVRAHALVAGLVPGPSGLGL